MGSGPISAQVLSAEVEFVDRRLDVPLRLASGTITELTEARAAVRVRCGGAEAVGRGAIYLSDVWAWPDPTLGHGHRDARLRSRCRAVAEGLPQLVGEPAHPLELGLRLHESLARADGPEEPPLLARVLCGAPFDAAIHDAVGRAVMRSALALYESPAAIPSASAYFTDGDVVGAVRRALRPPARALQAWWVLGRDDDLAKERRSIAGGGYRAFKLKLLGDPHDDAEWTGRTYGGIRATGIPDPVLSADANGGYESADAVIAYLDELADMSPEAYAALGYMEQPTPWDLHAAAFDWRHVSARKPVLVDEGLTGLDILPLVVEQGWAGIALKTCKGHSLSLVAAAWGRERGMMLTMQDLTNPGIAAIHAALVAAYVRPANGVELNSPQYTPGANEAWLPRLAGLFKPIGGVHRVPSPDVPGLGSGL
jgi:L-alanine-DL-glutamate epimerase-like enolase superfamily enzyme